jgi:hypothetical protein
MNLEECTCRCSESGQVIITNPACPIHGNHAWQPCPQRRSRARQQDPNYAPCDLDSSDKDVDESRNYDEEKAKKEQEEKDRALEAEESLRVHLEVLNQAQYEDERIKKETMRNLKAEEDLSISRNLLKRISDIGHNISL